MEQDVFLKSYLDETQSSTLTSQTKLLLNKDGLKLLQETTEAVREAISKINVFKNYLNEQSKSSAYTQETNGTATVDEININQLTIASLDNSHFQSSADSNLQVFFTILNTKITELEIRETFEKLGFEDFVITIKNRSSHSFGFIKFSTEDAVNRAIDLKVSLNGQLIKIRPHKSIKSNACNNVTNTISTNQNEDANNVSNEIDESVLINISCGYQNRRILTNYIENDQGEQTEDLINTELETSPGHSLDSEMSEMNKSYTNDIVKEYEYVPTSKNTETLSSLMETDVYWRKNDYIPKPNKKHYDHPSKRYNRFSSKNRPNKFISKEKSRQGRNSTFRNPRNFDEKNERQKNWSVKKF